MEKKKMLIVISSENKDKISTALQFSTYSSESKFYNDIKVLFFGPSEKIAAEDKEIQSKITELMKTGINPFACVAIGNSLSITPRLEKIGFKMIGVGKEIAEAINSGYVPMVF